MKVLFLTHGGRGGADLVVRDLIVALPEHGIEPVCAVGGTSSTSIEFFSAHNIKVFPVKFRGWFSAKHKHRIVSSFLNAHDSVSLLSRIIKEEKVEVVVTNTSLIFDGALAAKACGIPHVWYVHEIVSRDPDLFPQIALKLDFFYSLICSLSVKVVAVSGSVKHEICTYVEDAHERNKIVVIKNGVQVKEDDKLPELAEGFTVFSAGYLSKRKGFEDLIFAAHEVCKHYKTAQFVIAGSRRTAHYTNLLRLRSDLQLQDNLTFVGFTTDIDEYYRRSTILVLPSRCEPFGMVLIEAMRAGVPVIAMHKSGGPEEFISHNVNGFLCSANTLADQIMYAFDNRELLEPIREAAFEMVKKDFTHQRVVQEFIQVLNSVKEE